MPNTQSGYRGTLQCGHGVLIFGNADMLGEATYCEQCSLSRPLTLYTVYDHPADYPQSVVVRRWFLTGDVASPEPGSPYLIGPSIDRIRMTLESEGLYRIPRDPADDPVIAEVWL